MNENVGSDNSDSSDDQVGLHVTSDSGRTEIEQPDPSGAREMSELPFRILLVSDLTPGASPEDWSSGKHVHRMDANRFADFMAETAPRLSLEVRNTLGDTPNTWDLELSFPDLEAFEPEQIARQMEPTAQLLDVRDLVEKVGDGTINLDTFWARLDEMGIEMEWADDLYRTLAGEDEPDDPDEPTGPEEGEGDESLDRLMGMVDVDEEEDDESSPSQELADSTNGDIASDAVDALMDAVRDDDNRSMVDASAVELLVENLNGALREQVRSIIQHEDVRKLEAAWRGLKFLVDRLNFRENVELVVLPAGREDLHEAMHHQVLVPEHDQKHEEPPVSLILVDEDFGHDHHDIEQLKDLAGTGESLQTPVVASVDPSFFGMKAMSGLRKLPALRPHLRGDEYVEWEGLRGDDASQFLALVLPPFLLRSSGSGSNGEGLSLANEEELWGGGALAVGVASAQSFADTGWPTHISEYTIGGLPVQSGPGGTSPLSALLSGSMQSELARAGFTVLSGEANRDRLHVTHVPTVQEPGTYDDPNAAAEARAEASLPCRLFAARAAHQLLEIEKDLDMGRSLTALREEIAAAMASFLGVPVPEEASEEDTDAEVGEQPVSVEHVTDVDLPNQEVLAIRVRPPDTILEPNVRLAMALRVPGSS